MNKEPDIEIIRRIEKKLDRTIRQIEFSEIDKLRWTLIRGFSINEKEDVTALRLDNLDIRPVINDISRFKKVKILTLQFCKLKDDDISFLHELKGLTTLNLSGNEQIKDFSFLRKLKELTTLNLSGNELKEVSFLRELNGLTDLYLRKNELKDVGFLEGLKNLKRFDLKSNPIENPPPEIVKQGLPAVRAYFRSLEKSARKQLNEVKVLLVGDSGAGKTSLVKRLLDESFNESESKTHGIKIRPMEVLVDLPGYSRDASGSTPTVVKAHLWDFGGQDIMHASHQFFLSKRALYILVVDSRKDRKTEYWLKLIESFGGNSQVLMVINKIDENPAFDVDRHTLMRKYKNIKGFFRTSCKTGSGIKEFKEALREAIPHVDLLKTAMAASWLRIKEKLVEETARFNYLNHQQFKFICKGENITDERSRTTLIEFLNELGIVLHFKQLELKDFHILNPSWVTEAAYKIINSQYLANNKGILEKENLNYVLNKEKIKTQKYDPNVKDIEYTSNDQSFIVSLMKEFELCYPLDNDRFLIPDLLGNQDPGFKLAGSKALKFIAKYDFLPKSVMPRLIIRLHRDIKEELRWRTGMVLENVDFNTTAVVRADEEENALFFQITGHQKREYLSIIRHALKEINQSYQQLQYEELIPLPVPEHILEKYNSPDNVPGMYSRTVSYKFLLGYELKGVKEYLDGETGISYPVSQLLDSVVSAEERNKERREEDFRFLIIQQTDIHPQVQLLSEKKNELETANLIRKAEKFEEIKRLSKKIRELEPKFEKEKGLKEECDKTAEKIARRFTWFFAAGHITVFIAWAVLIFRFGWDIIEKWTYLAGPLALAVHAVIFALTGRAFNSEKSKTQRLKKEKEKQYHLHRFNIVYYNRLKAELEQTQGSHDQLVESK